MTSLLLEVPGVDTERRTYDAVSPTRFIDLVEVHPSRTMYAYLMQVSAVGRLKLNDSF